MMDVRRLAFHSFILIIRAPCTSGCRCTTHGTECAGVTLSQFNSLSKNTTSVHVYSMISEIHPHMFLNQTLFKIVYFKIKYNTVG